MDRYLIFGGNQTSRHSKRKKNFSNTKKCSKFLPVLTPTRSSNQEIKEKKIFLHILKK